MTLSLSHTSTEALQLYPDRRMESDVSDDSGTSDSLSSDHWMLTQTDADDRDQQDDLLKSVKQECSPTGPSRHTQEVHQNSNVKVQEGIFLTLKCNA